MKRWVSLVACTALVALLGNISPQLPLSANATEQVNSVEDAKYIDVQNVPNNIKYLLDVPTNGTQKVSSSQVPSSGSEVSDLQSGILKSDNVNNIQMEDAEGNGIAKVFAVPVRYEDESGNMAFIDTSMTKESLFSSYDYHNTANSFTLKFSKKPDKGIRVDDTFNMAIYNPDKEKLPKGYIDQTDEGDGRMVYPQAFGEHTYVEYININTGIKENIVLEENIGKNRFDFVFESDEYIPVLAENHSMVQVVHKDNAEDVKYTFTPLYVYDSYKIEEADTVYESPSDEPVMAGPASGASDLESTELGKKTAPAHKHYTEDNHYEIVKLSDKKYRITSVVSKEFLDDPETVYPVIIDPSLGATNSNAQDSYVWKKEPGSNFGSMNYMRFGRKDDGDMIGYLRFTDLPKLPDRVNITDATLKLTFRPGQNSGEDGICFIVESKQWYENSITWNNQPYGEWGYFSSHHNYQYYEFNVKPFVETWYCGEHPNYGVDFTYANMIDDYNSVFSSEGEVSRAPTLTVTYKQPPSMTAGRWYSGTLNKGTIHWYTFTPSITRTYIVTAKSDTDTYGMIYQGATPLAQDDDDGDDKDFFMTYTLTAGVTYHIRVSGYNHTSTGSYLMIVAIANQNLFLKLDEVHSLAKSYGNGDAMKLTLQFLRRDTYNDSKWDGVAGKVDKQFVEYVQNRRPDLVRFFSTQNLQIYDYAKGSIDFYHLCATMNGIIEGGTTFMSLIVNIADSSIIASLSGWAGDLQTLVVDTYQLTNASNNYTVFKNKFTEIMGDENYTFSMSDLLADVDASNFADSFDTGSWGSVLFGTACKNYYQNTSSSKSNLRFSQFVSGIASTKSALSGKVGKYTKQKYLTKEWPLYEHEASKRKITLNLTDNQSNAARDAFTDYIWALYQAENT